MGREATSKTHMPALDGVRGLAILMVIASHYKGCLDASVPWEGALIKLCSLGSTGVDLFFVLSGFLITGILLDTRDDPAYFRNFYGRRAVRIFPLYYLYLFLEFVPVRSMLEASSRSDLMPRNGPLWYLLYASNLSPTRGVHDWALNPMWSLAVEEQFYLAWPLVLVLVPWRFVARLCLAGIATATAIRFGGALRGTWGETLHRLTLCRMDTLMLGALGAVALRDGRMTALATRLVRPGAVASAMAFAATVGVWWSFEPRFAIFETVGYAAAAGLSGCVVFWAATAGAGSPILNAGAFRFLGRYSYGIYVLHFLFYFQIESAMPRATLGQRLLVLLVNLATTAALTYVSWVAVERPALSLKRYFRYGAGRPAPVAASGREGRLAPAIR